MNLKNKILLPSSITIVVGLLILISLTILQIAIELMPKTVEAQLSSQLNTMVNAITEEERLALRKSGVVAFPEDLEIDRTIANRDLLAAKNIDDLVESSKGLYNPPAEFRK